MQARTDSNLTRIPSTANNGALPMRDIGRVVVVQGPGDLVSLVRTTADGSVMCDCSGFRTTRQCVHIVSAGAQVDREQTAAIIVAEARVDGIRVVATQLNGIVTVAITARGQQLALRPVDLPGLLRALDRVAQRLGVVRR